MIITVTGKPCSGKGTVSKLFCEKFGFKYIGTGDIFREYAKKFGFNTITDFQTDERIKIIDKLVDDKIYELGQKSLNENIVIDSRPAWHFIPNSFKVFIDIDDNIAGERLLKANRPTEKVQTLNEAIKVLKKRWNDENERYMEQYKVNNLNLNQYDFVVSSNSLTPEEIVDLIYANYKNFIKNH